MLCVIHLQQIDFGDEGIRVVGITGSYHMGKSYLLNCITGNINCTCREYFLTAVFRPDASFEQLEREQFEVAHGIAAQTKGIYVQAKPIVHNTTACFMSREARWCCGWMHRA